jgi:PPE-repeat protein
MAAVATQYAQWLNASAAQAAGAASQANATAAIFEAAKAAIAHPTAVSANRMQLLSLVRSNLLGFNAPAIAATEGAYESMWAQNVAALSGYHSAASAVAAQLTPWQQAPQAQSAPRRPSVLISGKPSQRSPQRTRLTWLASQRMTTPRSLLSKMRTGLSSPRRWYTHPSFRSASWKRSASTWERRRKSPLEPLSFLRR